eukprot:1155175-Pelagomonas_calceolata.AAC.2
MLHLFALCREIIGARAHKRWHHFDCLGSIFVHHCRSRCGSVVCGKVPWSRCGCAISCVVLWFGVVLSRSRCGCAVDVVAVSGAGVGMTSFVAQLGCKHQWCSLCVSLSPVQLDLTTAVTMRPGRGASPPSALHLYLLCVRMFDL